MATTSTSTATMSPSTTIRFLADALVQLAEGNLGLTRLPATPACRRMQMVLASALEELRAAAARG